MNSNFLLFQMGKVGSSAVKAGLRKAGQSVLHTHSSSEASEFYLTQANPVVITAIRDLVARNISAFFQNLDNNKNTYWYLGVNADLQNLSIEELIHQFKLRALCHMEEVILPWFDNFAKTFDFDVFHTPFDWQKGFQCYRLPSGSDLLLFRYENLAELPKVLSDYCGKPIQFERRNCSNEKWYAGYYEAFKNEIRFTSDELDYYYNNPLMKHFYDYREIEDLRARWSR